MTPKAWGWVLALGIVLWLFILGALVPWIVELLTSFRAGLPV